MVLSCGIAVRAVPAVDVAIEPAVDRLIRLMSKLFETVQRPDTPTRLTRTVLVAEPMMARTSVAAAGTVNVAVANEKVGMRPSPFPRVRQGLAQ